MLETLERLILDPVTEAAPYQVAANRPIEVTGVRAPSPEGHGVFLSDHQYPRPDATATYAGSRDSQGEPRFGKPKVGNRKIPVKVYITEASGVVAATNLATNPAGELVKKFADGLDFPVVRELGGTNGVSSISGEFRDKHSFDGSSSDTGMGSVPLTFPAAGVYTVSLFVWIPAAWDGAAPQIALEGYVGATSEKVVGADLSRRNEWQRIYSVIKVVAGDLVGNVVLRTLTAPKSAGTGVAYTDALQAESGAAPSPFLCGDTPGCSWNGLPNTSTSTRVGSGSDRKRFLQCLFDLQAKIEKLADEGGTMKRILPDGSWMVFDVREATFVGNWEKRFNQGQEEFSFELICAPGARLAPITFTAHEEKTLPVLKFVELEVPGNLPAYGDLLIEDIGNVSRNFVAISVASRFLDQSANADVFYEAEGRARLGGSQLAAGSGIVSGSEASKVVEMPCNTYWYGRLSTRSSIGTYTSHVGAQKMFARVFLPTGNQGAISLRVEYAQGDLLRWRPLPAVTFPANNVEGEWVIVDLGVVRLNRAELGIQRWEGRLATKTTNAAAGDKVIVDWIAVLPVEEFYGEARSLSVTGAPITTTVASDIFAQAGEPALTGQTAELGGKWTGTGDADDFKIVTAQRVAIRNPTAMDVAGAADDPPCGTEIGVTGRWDRLGTGVQEDVTVQSYVAVSGSNKFTERVGLFCRYVDINNMLMARITHTPGELPVGYKLEVWKKKAGAWSLKASGTAATWFGFGTMSLSCAPDGSGSAVVGLGGGPNALTWEPDADLATGGVLATGGYGAYHALGVASTNKSGAGASEASSYIYNFAVYAGSNGSTDRALYPNKDLRVRWDKTTREAGDGSGAFTDVGLWNGDRLLIPPSGREARPVRIAILASRGLPATPEGDLPLTDVQADDIKATLTVTPRVSEVPKPS